MSESNFTCLISGFVPFIPLLLFPFLELPSLEYIILCRGSFHRQTYVQFQWKMLTARAGLGQHTKSNVLFDFATAMEDDYASHDSYREVYPSADGFDHMPDLMIDAAAELETDGDSNERPLIYDTLSVDDPHTTDVDRSANQTPIPQYTPEPSVPTSKVCIPTSLVST